MMELELLKLLLLTLTVISGSSSVSTFLAIGDWSNLHS